MNPPTPSTYAKLLTLSHAVIKQADPKAKVMFAGLLSHPNGATAWDFLNDVYKQPGARYAFDIMASNAYSSSVSRMLDDLSHIRQTMAANGQGPKPLWITEVGWGSDPADTARGTKGMLGQRKILIQAFNALLQKRETLAHWEGALVELPRPGWLQVQLLRVLHLGGPPDQRL